MKKIIEAFRSAPDNLRDLLTRIRAKRQQMPCTTSNQVSPYMSNLVTCANHVARLLKTRTLESTKIANLFGIEGRLEQYLIRRGFSRFTVQNRLSAVRVLVSHASSFGFDHASFRLAAEWNRILKLIRPRIGFSTIVAFAVSNKVHPSKFDDSHLEEWGVMKFRQGRSQLYVSAVKAAFRNAIRDANLGSVFLRLNVSGQKVPYPGRDKMPPALRSDIRRILAWVRRQVSNKRLRINISVLTRDLIVLCAHVVSLPGGAKIRTVDQVLRKDHLRSYIQFLKNKRNCKRSSIASRLTRIHTLIQVHPRFRKRDFSWWTPEIRKYRPDPPSTFKERRRQRLLAYEELANIPARMERAWQALQDPFSSRAMWLLHDLVLMHMLISALIPSRCVWRCRVSGPRPNVWRGPVPKGDARLAIPKSADRILQAQPDAEFWLFRFYPSDAPNLKEAQGFVLSEIVPLLEFYVEQVRPRLLGSKHTNQLFLHRRGGGITCKLMRARVLNLTQHFGGKAVVPGSIRESFSDYWLESCPDDFQSLADVLWMELPSVLRKYVHAETIVA